MRVAACVLSVWLGGLARADVLHYTGNFHQMLPRLAQRRHDAISRSQGLQGQRFFLN